MEPGFPVPLETRGLFTSADLFAPSVVSLRAVSSVAFGFLTLSPRRKAHLHGANMEAKWQCLAFPKDFTPATDEIRRIPQLGLSKKTCRREEARASAQTAKPP